MTDTMTLTTLTAEKLSKKYGRNTVFKDLSLEIEPGEFVAIMGPSGSGKSTLLGILSGLDKPTSGRVNAPTRTQRAFVFQDYNLLESLSARRNAELTATFSRRPCTRRQVSEVFDSLGLAGLDNRLPAQLSGGQQQRVAVARALLARAPFVFADEPTGALDESTAALVMEHLRRIPGTVVMVTHSMAAAQQADRIITLEAQRVRVA
ncbi:ABC transporter ATP-binding protein [Corynebacterium sp.]|uniref:ABC transporter ATP-binding protein n=1 Tax=Corynebacterium sp. TaxID=1720 RepID=UPI0026DB2FC8|nr:ABC transporter ATP-binding protein [Corynebacterium sp.]MDO5032139.1 ABC transporter ATP-binding protein [Corynebacterium sp.]